MLLESESKNECDGGNADLGRGVKDSVDGGRVYGYPLLIQTIRKVFGISDLYGIRVSYLDDEGEYRVCFFVGLCFESFGCDGAGVLY